MHFSMLSSTSLQVLTGVPNHASPVFQESLKELRNICSVKSVLPKSCALPGSFLGCVYEGTLDGAKVRIRRIRTHPRGDPQKTEEVGAPCRIPRLLAFHKFPRPSTGWP